MKVEGAQSNQFLVSKSFLCSAALARLLEKAYGLSKVRCQLIQATMRDVYQVATSHQSYVLFIYHAHQRTAAEITAEWDFIDYLDAGGVAVAPAVRQSNGQLLLAIDAPEGVRHAVLSTFVEGKHLRHKYSVEAVRRYGRAIAQIHALADTMPHTLTPHTLMRPRNEFDSIVAQSIAAFETVYPNRTADIAYLHQVAPILETGMNLLPKEKPVYGLIHGDAIRANAQVSENGSVTVLDFDLCGWGWRSYDVASFLQAIEGTPQQEEAGQAFLDGYQQIRTLTKEEMDSLPLFVAARHIFSIGVPALNAYHWGGSYLSDTSIKSSLDGIRRHLEKSA